MPALRILWVVLPLALDTFAVAAALGAAGLRGPARIRVPLVFAAFEGGMPLVGLLLGGRLGAAIGSVADWLAAALLVVLGVVLLREGRSDDETATDGADGVDGDSARAARLVRARGLGVLSLGLAVSLDELVLGFTLGLLRVPVLPAVVAIAAQTFVVAWLGLTFGARVGEQYRERAEQLAGVALVAYGGMLAAERLLS